MDQWKAKLELPQQQHQHLPNSLLDPRERTEVEVKDTNAARKVQKADREKLRRGKLNEQFDELGNVLDPDRPKNDKASILIDTVQVLKDLTSEVSRMKAECTALSEESCELMLEKNELREEKSSLKSEIENLSAQYHQRVGAMFPWGAMDPSSVVMPHPYSFPVPPMHPFPFFGNHNPPGAIPTSSPAFVPYPCPPISQAIHAPTSSKQESGIKPLDRFRGTNDEKGDNCSEVVTELQLKTPGSKAAQESDKKGRRVDGSCSSSFQESSSNSVVDNNGTCNE